MAQRNECRGYCCEAFSLGRRGPSDFERARVIALRGEGEDAEFVLQITDMLVPLGYYGRNPLFVVRGDADKQVVRLNPALQVGSWFYTCKHFDRQTRDCGIYEQRLSLCRSFPNDGPCPFEGCDYAVPYRMEYAEYWGGMYVSKGLFFDECSAFARALGVPEPEPLSVMEMP